MPDLELRHLRYLIAVAETGSITRAAQRLRITQPALSRAVRGLERHVGVALFVRRAHATELTAAGDALLSESYELVERAERALERVRTVRPDSETLRVTARGCDVLPVAAVGRSFEEQNPGVRLEVVPYDWASQPDALRKGAADVAFLRDSHDRRDLAVRRLMEESRVAMLRDDHPAAHRDNVTLSDLKDEPITQWADMSPAEAEHWAGADLGRHTWRRGPQVRSSSDVIAAVRLGMAIAFVPASTLPGSEIPGVRIRAVDGLSPSRLEIGLPANSASRLARSFADHAITVLRTPPTVTATRR